MRIKVLSDLRCRLFCPLGNARDSKVKKENLTQLANCHLRESNQLKLKLPLNKKGKSYNQVVRNREQGTRGGDFSLRFVFLCMDL